MTLDLPSLLTLVGTVLTVVVAMAAAVLKWKPDMIVAQGGRIDRLWERLDEQDRKIDALEAKIDEQADEIASLKDQRETDKQVRHQLKGALAYAVSVAQQAIAAIVESWSEEEIRALPEPLRAHVLGTLDFTDHLDLTRPRN